jgi:dTDP-4-amino-4,6-dideoxygalactose transaminase
MMPRYLAPTGSPIGPGDLAAWIGALASERHAGERLSAAVAARFDLAYCGLVSTGRAGLTVMLRAFASLRPGRTEVIVPGYTCYSVAASIVKAGLRPRVVDIDPMTLDYLPDRLSDVDTAPVLAMLATNLYGAPNDLPAHEQFARARGIFLIDDAAQAMGARVAGRPSGTWGDAGLYSLDKGKNITAMEGGLIVTRVPEVGTAFARELARAEAPGGMSVARDACKLLAYAMLLPPACYWLPQRIPQLGLGATVYTTDFPIHRYPDVLAAMGRRMLRHLDRFTEARRARAAALAAALRDVPGLRMPGPAAGAEPACLRFPLLAEAPLDRDALVARLTAAGIGATTSYPGAILDIPELQPLLAGQPPTPGARHVARHIVTLPTHPYVTMEDVRRIGELVCAAPGPARAVAEAH